MARDGYTVPELIYAPAKRSASCVLIMLAGTWGSGKTRSALELATGLAEGGAIGVADTEHGRSLLYADKYKFDHLDLAEPFRSEAFEQAAIVSQKRGHRVWICDNFSWEHVGPGGQLEWHAKEVERMSKGDWSKAEQMNAAAWIAPKSAHAHMLQRFWQLNCHLILCVQAKKKLVITTDPKNGKQKWVDAGWQPVCGEDIPYAMTTALMMRTDAPGTPEIIKHQEDIDPMIPLDRPLSAEVGRRIAAWARGEPLNPTPPSSEAAAAPPAGKPRGAARELALAEELIARFAAVTTRREHFVVVDAPDYQERAKWFHEHRPALSERIAAALQDSWTRTGEPDASAQTDEELPLEPAQTGDPSSADGTGAVAEQEETV